jgi:hypothetical protein
MLNSFRPSSSNYDSGRNPLLKDKQTVQNFDVTFRRVDRYRTYENHQHPYLRVDIYKINPLDASCKTALDLLPPSNRYNGAQNEKSNEELYKEKLENFKLQLIELNEFSNKQQLTKDNRRRFTEEIARIIVNISELDDLIPYLIKEKSKTITNDVSIGAKPQPIKFTPSDLLPPGPDLGRPHAETFDSIPQQITVPYAISRQ